MAEGYEPIPLQPIVFDYYALLSKTKLTTSYETYSTYNNRSFGDYKILSFSVIKGSWVIGEITIPKTQFESTNVAIMTSYNNTTPIEVDIKYISDTSISAKYVSSTDDINLRIAGFVSEYIP